MKKSWFKSIALLVLALTVLIGFIGCNQKVEDKTTKSFTYKTYTAGDVTFEMAEIPAKGSEISAFLMGKTEVTQKLWAEVTGTAPSHFPGFGWPVESVNWYQCIAFCNELTKKVNGSDAECVYYTDSGFTTVYTDPNGTSVYKRYNAKGFQLPISDEWEHAAKGGENYTYAGSNDIDKVAWYSGNSENKTHPVGGKNPNGYGLYDMSGNVWEWCWDASGSNRIIRSGAWGGLMVFVLLRFLPSTLLRIRSPPRGACAWFADPNLIRNA